MRQCNEVLCTNKWICSHRTNKVAEYALQWAFDGNLFYRVSTRPRRFCLSITLTYVALRRTDFIHALYNVLRLCYRVFAHMAEKIVPYIQIVISHSTCSLDRQHCLLQTYDCILTGYCSLFSLLVRYSRDTSAGILIVIVSYYLIPSLPDSALRNQVEYYVKSKGSIS